MDKQIAVVVAGAQDQEVKDVTIKPGTSVRDILSTLELDRYILSRRDGTFLNPNDDVYDKVENGEKLFASAEADVGEVGFMTHLRPFFPRFVVSSRKANRPK